MEQIKKLIISSLLLLVILRLEGQDDTFKPGGKPVFLLFNNIHATFNSGNVAPAFEITRLYLGYEYSFSRSLSARANIDIGNPGAGGLQMTAYVRHAYMRYQSDKFSARTGMIGTDQFSLIDQHWGYRYVAKTLQDEYGFGPSADLGAAVEYSPAKYISLDASVLNGEGFRRIESDSALKYTLGITLTPVENLKLRGYTDFMKKDALQNTFSFFAAYTYDNARVGVEYSMQKNNRMISGHDFSGISVFSSMSFDQYYSIFARYDYVWSEKLTASPDPWNIAADGHLLIAGFEFSPLKGIRISPVFRGRIPAAKTGSFTASPGLYFEIKL